jgi:hypothetical protein
VPRPSPGSHYRSDDGQLAGPAKLKDSRRFVSVHDESGDTAHLQIKQTLVKKLDLTRERERTGIRKYVRNGLAA